MPIINAKAPAGTTAVQYGRTSIAMNDDGSVDVPAYVARSLADAGFIAPDLPANKTVAQLLTASDAWEGSYIIQASGQRIGINPYAPAPAEGEQPADYDQMGHAQAALADKGEPKVSVISG